MTMITTEFDKAFGTTELCLSELLLKVHDAAPNGDKRRWELLVKAVDGMIGLPKPSLELLAAALGDAARHRLDDMVAAVGGAEAVLTPNEAREAVLATDVGDALREIIDMAERAGTEASALSKQVNASLAEKQSDRDVLAKAKDIQLSKAMAGSPVSLLTAMELAKMAG
jgi:predicted ATPase